MLRRKSHFSCGFGAAVLLALVAWPASAETSDKEAAQDKQAVEPERQPEKRKNDSTRKEKRKAAVEKAASDKPTAEKSAVDKKTANKQSDKKGKTGPGKIEKRNVSAEDKEALALALVREHHPELSELLEQLKADNPKQYQQAIAELYGSSLRLSQFKEKDAERYRLELKAWQLDSRARLLAAKLTMETRPESEGQLRAVLAEREDVRIELLSLERTRAAERLTKIEGQLATLREDRPKRIDRAFDQLMRRIANTRPKAKAAKETKQRPDSKTDKSLSPDRSASTEK